MHAPARDQMTAPHLGGHAGITHIDEGALDCILNRYPVLSFIDIGCGPGDMTRLARAKGLAACGIDGDPACKPDIVHDFTTGPIDSEFPIKEPGPRLAWMVEFVEHVHERDFIFNVVPLLRHCQYVFMTHALPGQTGHHHVNCQPESYWIFMLTSLGFVLDLSGTQEIRLASTMGREFTRQTGKFFKRSAYNA